MAKLEDYTPEEGEAGPEEAWIVKGVKYLIFDQGDIPGEGRWAIRVDKKGQESSWITWPESAYDTLGGCRYAILMNLGG